MAGIFMAENTLDLMLSLKRAFFRIGSVEADQSFKARCMEIRSLFESVLVQQ